MNVQEIKDLIRCFQESGLERMKLSEGNLQLELNRSVPMEIIEKPIEHYIPTQDLQKTVTYDANGKMDQQSIEEPLFESVKAPLVGTFYAAPSPEQSPFVQVGDKVKKGDPLCLIEAMKMMNEVKAPCDGIIKEILVSDASFVEYGQVLMRYLPC